MFKALVYKNEYGYSVSCANKKEDVNCYINVRFYGDIKPPQATGLLDVKDCFFTARKNNKEQVEPVLMIGDYILLKSYLPKDIAETNFETKEANLDDDFPF